MGHSTRLSLTVLGLLLTSGSALAAQPFDGSVPLLCALNQAQECSPENGCAALQLYEIDAPAFFRVDVRAKEIIPVRLAADDQRRSEIRGTGEVDGKLILQGYEDGIEDVRDGLGWTMAIAQDTGQFVLSASGDQVAFLVFGACTTLDAGTP
jgi:hypothetical protein